LDKTAMNKAQKMVKMVELMTRRGGVQASQLLDRFELDPRSLRRYLADMRDIDVPIRDDGRAEDRFISIDPRWRRTGVQLSLAEVLSLHFGRTLFNFLEGTSFAEDLEGAIERLEPAISRTHQDLTKQLDVRFVAVPEPSKDFGGTASELLDDIVTAIVYNNPLESKYRKANGVERTLVIHPYTLATFRQGLYLFALDVDADQIKTYAIERFVDVARRRGLHFAMPSSWDPAVHLEHAFGIITGPPERVVIAFRERAITYIRERTWHPTQSFRTLPDGRLELSMDVVITVELKTWIQGFAEDSQVLAPDHLVGSVRDALAEARDQYEDPS
jgi:predicted DNA-binding transcriptional regulator YafY